jgi:glutamyl-tRNA synthetase
MIKTRFAPSPTGWLHIGGVRTALFSWLFAKSQNGEFLVRIDDTDTTRSTQQYCDAIISALNSLGLNSDQDLIYQSKRFDIYIDRIESLLEKGLAYYDKVEITDKTKDTNLEIQYDNRLNKPGNVIRFKNPRDKKIVLKDMVHNDITFDPKTFHDVVILRSNGIPTYNLTSVVDDADMGITHIIRGDDHLSNTAVQINLFNSLDYEVPIFGHLPMIHGVDGKRLSKRHGAVDINSFLDDGYLVEALINYLVKTGWSHGDDEFFTRNQLLEMFTIDKVTKSSAIFDYDKLNWLNQHYIKNKNIEDITDMILPYLEDLRVEVKDRGYLEKILSLGIDRDYNLKDIANGMTHYFKDELTYDLTNFPKINIDLSKAILSNVSNKIEANKFSDKEQISEDIKQVCADMSLKFKDIGPVVRFALTAKLKAPSIDELCFTLGKIRTLKRLKDFSTFIINL